MSLLWSDEPVSTVGYKHIAPLEPSIWRRALATNISPLWIEERAIITRYEDSSPPKA